MQISELLTSAGLNQREATVYLALLELGEGSVQEIAKKAVLQRPNCYSLLEDLAQKGLVSQQTKLGARRYIAEDPKKLKSLLEEKIHTLDDLLPNLRSLYAQGPDKPRARFYEGKESIKQVYEEVLRSNGYDCLYTPASIVPVFGDFVEEFARRAFKDGLKIREIVAGLLRPPFYDKYFKSPRQEVRYLSEAVTQGEFILFENKVAMISYTPHLHALVVEGSAITQMVQIMFEQTWANASATFSPGH